MGWNYLEVREGVPDSSHWEAPLSPRPSQPAGRGVKAVPGLRVI